MDVLDSTPTTTGTRSSPSSSQSRTLPLALLELQVSRFLSALSPASDRGAFTGPYGNGDGANQGQTFSVSGTLVAFAGSANDTAAGKLDAI